LRADEKIPDCLYCQKPPNPPVTNKAISSARKKKKIRNNNNIASFDDFAAVSIPLCAAKS
jgi:hypothetical protein